MTAYRLKNEDHSIQVEVVPEYGGMISQIWMKRKELLHLDRQVMLTAPMAAGGCPILFPFASRTANDTYYMGEIPFRMPMHGLVKNEGFAGEQLSENSARVWITSNSAWKEQYYPFEFTLEVLYTVKEHTIRIELTVRNQSERRMPHSLGLHPFFYASDKKRLVLKHGMKVHYDYIHGVDREMIDLDDLSLRWDDVFHTAEDPGFILENTADGYQVICRGDQGFQSMVVCSWVKESICVEPWTGIPDGINRKRFLHWIEPGGYECCQVEFILKEM